MATNPKPRKTKSKSKPKKPVKRRATRVTNQNTVRVHVINSVGGDSAPPPPYSGPDRGYFAFNPVFDLGGPKQPVLPPMNTGIGVATGPIKREAELAEPDREGIFEGFLDRAHESLGLGSGVKLEPGSPVSVVDKGIVTDKMPEEMTRNELRDIVKNMGISIGKKKKNELLRIVKTSRG